MRQHVLIGASLVLLLGAFYGLLRGWFPATRDHPTISALLDLFDNHDDDAVLPSKTPPVGGYPPITTERALSLRKVGEARTREVAAPEDGSGKLP